ncbi:MAG TPA: hypothetical protein PK267_01495, partial [Atribacterota bacterium]|nr:hypothetical protein [Atribacterota bacterium]
MYLQALARLLKVSGHKLRRSRSKFKENTHKTYEVSVLSDYTTSSYYSQHSYSSQQYTVNMS